MSKDENRDELLLPEEVTLCKRIDLTQLVEDCDCKLAHSKLLCDYLAHLFQKYGTLFTQADKIVMERQQPGGGGSSVQELIMSSYREKCVLIAPSTLHRFLHISHLTYDQRKERTVQFAMDFLNDKPDFMFEERKHDIADALCFLVLYLRQTQKRSGRLSRFGEHITKYMFKENGKRAHLGS